MARAPVLAAGGIVLRPVRPPLIAVVRLRKRNEWVLPKGKLDDGETPRDAAEREVNEETGHDVIVHEFLGTLVYESGGRSKIVHYWRMQADGDQVYELMTDIREVDWLPLEVALTRLSRGYERAFLENVGPLAVAAAIADLSRRKPKAAPAKKRRPRAPVPAKPKPTAPMLPAAAVPVELADPVLVPMELSPVVPEAPVDIESDDVVETTPPAETAEPLPTATRAALPVDQSDPMQSADPPEPAVVVPECEASEREASACEPETEVVAEIDPVPAVEAAEGADPAPIDSPETDADEPRRKTLAEKLRNWLGSAA